MCSHCGKLMRVAAADPDPPRAGTQSVERAFAVLKAVAARQRAGASLATLTQALHLNRSTTYRILKCLVDQGAVRFDDNLAGYVLGPLALDLAIAAGDQLSLKERASAILGRVAAQTGDTVFLLLRSEDDSVCIDRQSGSFPIKTLVVEVGTRRPLGVGSGTTAMLGAMTDEQCRQVALRNSRRFPAFGTSPDAVLKAAASARRLGYAATPAVGVEGASALGVAILDSRREPVAALALAAIDRRMQRTRQKELLEILLRAADACGKALFP
jgi:DNA-binding IclR family transcriptional regulator